MVASAITFGAIVGAFPAVLSSPTASAATACSWPTWSFFVVAAIACAFAPNEYVLAGARFVMGLGVGIDLPVAMAFLAEFSKLEGKGNKASRVAMWCPTSVRGHLRVLSISAALLLGAAESHSNLLWRIILGFGAVPALVIIAVRSRYMSESPVWAANQGDLEGAAKILRQSYGIDAVVAPTPWPSRPSAPPRGATTGCCSRACTRAARCWPR